MKSVHILLTAALVGAGGVGLSWGGVGVGGTMNVGNEPTTVVENASNPTTANWSPSPTVEANKFVFDTTVDAPATYTLATAAASKYVTSAFNLTARVVPETLRAVPSTTPQLGFCIVTNRTNGGAAVFSAYAKLGADAQAGWIPLSGVAAPGEGADYALEIAYDFRAGAKVKFAVKCGDATTFTDLCHTTSGDSPTTTTWFDAATSVSAVNGYKFVGTGEVASFSTATYVIESQAFEPTIGSKTVEVNVPDAVLSKLDVPSGTTAEAYLATTDATTGRKVLDDIVLGLRVANGNSTELKDNGQVLIKGDAKASSLETIPLQLNITPPSGTGATITYVLMGSEDNKTFTTVRSGTAVPEVQMNDLKTYKYFKVQAQVTYTPKSTSGN